MYNCQPGGGAGDVRRSGRFLPSLQRSKGYGVFTVPLVIRHIENYCLRNGIGPTERIFPITERIIQKPLAIVCKYLGYRDI